MDRWSTGIGEPITFKSNLLPEEVLRIRNDPFLGVRDDRYFQNLLFLNQQSDDPYHRDLLKQHIHRKILDAMRNPDAFYPNLPPRNALPQLTPNRAPLLYFRNGAILSLPLGKGGTGFNVILTGRTGGGKTNVLIILLLAYSGKATIVIFDRKGDLAKLAKMRQPGEVVVLDASKDVRLSLNDGNKFMSREEHIAQISDLFNKHLHLRSSRRLFTFFAHEGEEKICIETILRKLEAMNVAQTSKMGLQRDALLSAFRDLKYRTGNLFTSRESNFLERVFEKKQTVIITWGRLSQDHADLMASWIFRYAYESRRTSGKTRIPIIFGVDDAMSIVSGTKSTEAEGHANPFATLS